VQLAGGAITYTPPTGFTGSDSFNYILTPSSGPNIQDEITVEVDISFIAGATMNGGQASMQFVGVPNTLYDIEASTDLINWTVVGTVESDANGLFQFQDANSASFPVRFYRTMLP
jgi:hypothetical protein